MSVITMAVAGKGGTGKTTVCSLLIRELVKMKMTPILAVDADPNTNLAESLGAQPETTIGSVLAEFQASRMSMPLGITKESYLQLKIEEALEETKDVDFLVMGRKQGSGCYCVPNTIMKNYLEKVVGNYRCMVVDNEAGMEHLSRKNIENLDVLILVSDHSVKGLRACARIAGLAGELGINIGRKVLIVNRWRPDDEETLKPMVEAVGVGSVYRVPDDAEVTRADAVQKSFYELPDDSKAVMAVSELLHDILGLAAGAGKAG